MFYYIDNFANGLNETINSHALPSPTKKSPTRIPELHESEIMTIILMFQESLCRNFEYFYQPYLTLYKAEFPHMPTYERFVSLMPRVLYLLVILLYSLLPPSKGLNYIDSTPLAVCHPKRIFNNKVFQGFAALGKTSTGWFFGWSVPQMYAGEVEM